MKRTVLAMIMGALLVSGSVARAQGQEGPPPFPGDGPGRPPFGGGPGPMGGPFGGPREITAATIPVDALGRYLKLTAAQQQKITGIAERLRAERPRPPMPPRGGENGDNPPPRPSEAEMTAMRKKMQAAEAKANQAILATLTSEQKGKLSTLVKALYALRADHIGLDGAAKLNLSSSQIKRLAAAGKSATHEVVVSDFTADQTEVADRFRREPGRFPGGGGFPGGGPPPGGGPGGGEGF